MKIVRPVSITDAVLTSSSVAEADYAIYAAGNAYAKGARIIRPLVHRIFESLIDGNVGHTPEASPNQWLDVGATNRWKMFDEARGSATTAADEIVVTLAPGRISCLALLDLVADHVTVVMMVGTTKAYDRTISTAASGKAVNSWWAYFFEARGRRSKLIFDDIPPYAGGIITVTISGSPVAGGGGGGSASIFEGGVWNDAGVWDDAAPWSEI